MSAFGPSGPGFTPPENAAVFVISVVAEITGLHPQTLRQYDRLGLVSPQRTPGGGRRYSAEDIARLHLVQSLAADGVNLSGIERILALQETVAALRAEVAVLRARLGDPDPDVPRVRDLVPLPTPGALVVWRREPA